MPAVSGTRSAPLTVSRTGAVAPTSGSAAGTTHSYPLGDALAATRTVPTSHAGAAPREDALDAGRTAAAADDAAGGGTASRGHRHRPDVLGYGVDERGRVRRGNVVGDAQTERRETGRELGRLARRERRGDNPRGRRGAAPNQHASTA